MDIEEIIRRAHADGRFQELEGKGKPLNLAKRQLLDPIVGIAKEAGFAPEWALIGKDLDGSEETVKKRIEQWKRRRDHFIEVMENHLKQGRSTDARKAARQANDERDAVARDLAKRWLDDRRSTERYNLLVTGAQHRIVPSPERLLAAFLEASPDLAVSDAPSPAVIERPAALDAKAVLEEIRAAEPREESGGRKMSSQRAEALLGFKARYGTRR